MATDAYLRSYGDTAIVQDVVGLIEILTATDDWFLSNLGKTTAVGVVHQTQTQALRTVGGFAIEEASDLTIDASTTPTLVPNLVMHVGIPFAVSVVQQTVAHYSGQDELARQLNLALTESGNEIEFHIVRSVLTSGISGTVPKMSGIFAGISRSTNSTAHNSGTVWSASILNGLMRNNWAEGNGVLAKDLFMGSFLRYVTDTFTTKTNQLFSGPAGQILNNIDLFKTSFGNLSVHTHRHVHSSSANGLGADSTGRILAVNPEYIKIAYLNQPYVLDLSVTGPATKKAVLADLTMEFRNRLVNFQASGFDID